MLDEFERQSMVFFDDEDFDRGTATEEDSGTESEGEEGVSHGWEENGNGYVSDVEGAGVEGREGDEVGGEDRGAEIVEESGETVVG